MRNWDLLVHQGSEQVQHATADEAVLSEDGEKLLAENIILRARMDDEGGQLRARSPRGTVILGGLTPLEADKEHFPTYDEVVGYLDLFEFRAFHGDMLLDGVDGNTIAEIGEDGLLTSRYLIWSERFDRFLSPTTFTQVSNLEDGGVIEITGGALSIDSEFRDWTYFGSRDAEQPVVLTYTAPPAED